MDRIESLGNALSQITMYDIKSMYNQVRRTPVAARGMEHRIDRRLCRPRMSSSMSARWKRRSVTRRTTNPGMSICRYVNGESAQLRRGASSTLMQEIAAGYVSCFRRYVCIYSTAWCLVGPSTCEWLQLSRRLRVLTRRSQNFNEIMPAIYARFMEKEARQWRQIYKVRMAWYMVNMMCVLTLCAGPPAAGVPRQEW